MRKGKYHEAVVLNQRLTFGRCCVKEGNASITPRLAMEANAVRGKCMPLPVILDQISPVKKKEDVKLHGFTRLAAFTYRGRTKLDQ